MPKTYPRCLYPKCPYDFKPFQQALRALGFKSKYPRFRIRSDAAIGYSWSHIYHKTGEDFDLEVMLESDGEHFARHFFKGRNTERGTAFSSVGFLEAAINTEMGVIERKRTGWQTPEMKQADRIWKIRGAHMKEIEAKGKDKVGTAQAYHDADKSSLCIFKDGTRLQTTMTKAGKITHKWS